MTENPTPKFGEALRAQVEERLNFFETGAPPSKNADAIRRVLEDLALEEGEDDGDEDGNNMNIDGPALTTLEATPAKPKKSKKRKSEEMDVDEEEEAPSSKKVKLSKEEKKALKKAMKAKAKSEAAVVVSFFRPASICRRLTRFSLAGLGAFEGEGTER